MALEQPGFEPVIGDEAAPPDDVASVVLVDDQAAPERRTTLTEHAHGFYWTEGVRGLGWDGRRAWRPDHSRHTFRHAGPLRATPCD